MQNTVTNILTKVEDLLPGDSGIESDGSGFVIYAVEPGDQAWMTKVSLVIITSDFVTKSITTEYLSHTTWVVDRPMKAEVSA